MLNKLIDFLAHVLPDYCPFEKQIYIGGYYLFTTPKLCGLNPLYDRIIKRKIELLGYDLDILEDGANSYPDETENRS